MMQVRWITAFVDRPPDRFEPTVDFWSKVTGSTLSPWRGGDDEFATLLPADGGDAHLRVQRTDSGSAGSHIDLHVDDVQSGIDHCTGLGATMVADHTTFAVLSSPGGMPFCLVADGGERTRQQPVVVDGSDAATLVDQVCIDVDPDGLDDELRFWSAVTGLPPVSARSLEFVPLERPSSLPLRLMLQVRSQAVGSTSCHLDLACDDVPAAVAEHEALGAIAGEAHRYWTVMTDPSGVEYCLTKRLPTTGLLSPDEP